MLAYEFSHYNCQTVTCSRMTDVVSLVVRPIIYAGPTCAKPKRRLSPDHDISQPCQGQFHWNRAIQQWLDSLQPQHAIVIWLWSSKWQWLTQQNHPDTIPAPSEQYLNSEQTPSKPARCQHYLDIVQRLYLQKYINLQSELAVVRVRERCVLVGHASTSHTDTGQPSPSPQTHSAQRLLSFDHAL